MTLLNTSLHYFVAHAAGSKEGLYGTTLMRDLEAALESALTPLAGALDSRAKDILVAFEQEVCKYICVSTEMVLFSSTE